MPECVCFSLSLFLSWLSLFFFLFFLRTACTVSQQLYSTQQPGQCNATNEGPSVTWKWQCLTCSQENCTPVCKFPTCSTKSGPTTALWCHASILLQYQGGRGGGEVGGGRGGGRDKNSTEGSKGHKGGALAGDVCHGHDTVSSRLTHCRMSQGRT